MNKLFLVAIAFSAILCSCNKTEYVKAVSFGQDSVVFSSNKQELELKANVDDWYMTVYTAGDSSMRGDTIIGDWYTLIQKNNGESLLIKVDENKGEKRGVCMGMQNGNFFTELLLIQKGKED